MRQCVVGGNQQREVEGDQHRKLIENQLFSGEVKQVGQPLCVCTQDILFNYFRVTIFTTVFKTTKF